MLDYLVEDWVLLLFKLPVSNIGGCQSSWPHTNSYFLAGFLVVWIRPNSCLALSVKGVIALSRTALTPGYGILFN